MDVGAMMIVGGALIGMAGAAVLWRLAGQIERTQPEAASRGTPRVLRIAAVADLILLPLVMYLVARFVIWS
jgi:hypothetical protein